MKEGRLKIMLLASKSMKTGWIPEKKHTWAVLNI